MIELLLASNDKDIKAVAELLKVTFPWAYGEDYSALEEARSLCIEDYIAYLFKEAGKVLGIVGARPQYGSTGWELHPLAVDKSARGRGIAKLLMQKIESEVIDKGGIIMYLGTDDEFNQTSLSNTDLFEDTFEAIQNIKNLKDHPYSFYQKIGYKIVGVIPDANGWNKPDIMMAKRLVVSPKDFGGINENL